MEGTSAELERITQKIRRMRSCLLNSIHAASQIGVAIAVLEFRVPVSYSSSKSWCSWDPLATDT